MKAREARETDAEALTGAGRSGDTGEPGATEERTLGDPGAVTGRPPVAEREVPEGRAAAAGRPAQPPGGDSPKPLAPPDPESDDLEDLDEDDTMESEAPDLVRDRRRIVTAVVIITLGLVAIYVLLPKLVGLDDALARLGRATWYWIVIAVGFNLAGFAAYVALFRGVLGGNPDEEVHRRLDVAASYQITMAGLAATRIFSAAGAGGIALTYWALRKAGMKRRRAACRMVAFLAVLYSVYLLALVVFGVLLRTGVLPGPNPFGGTIIPAIVAGSLIAGLGLVPLIPGAVERRLTNASRRFSGLARFAGRLATGPATVATGVRTAIAYVRHPRGGALALGGAVGFWAANIAILWASFEAFGGDVAFAVLVQGFFVGMAANVIPSPAGGVGSVDAGMIGAFLLFDVPTAVVFPAVLAYRVVAFWLPIPPGVVAYFQLRRTVAEWERERAEGYTSQSKAAATEAT